MLQLGDRPHWMVELAGPGHPPPAGRCGVRGDLRDGGAVQLRIGADFWMTAAPVSRVDDDLLEEVREDLMEAVAIPRAGHVSARLALDRAPRMT